MGSAVKRLAKLVNPAARRIAELGLIPVWGVIVHTGRRSGRTFETPIALAKTHDGFVIPLPWGQGTDWCRNLVAADGAIIRWGGRAVRVAAPEFLDQTEGARAFPAPIRRLIPVIGIERFVRVHIAG